MDGLRLARVVRKRLLVASPSLGLHGTEQALNFALRETGVLLMPEPDVANFAMSRFARLSSLMVLMADGVVHRDAFRGRPSMGFLAHDGDCAVAKLVVQLRPEADRTHTSATVSVRNQLWRVWPGRDEILRGTACRIRMRAALYNTVQIGHIIPATLARHTVLRGGAD